MNRIKLGSRIAAAIAGLVGLAVLAGAPASGALVPLTEVQVTDSDAANCLGPKTGGGTAGAGDRVNTAADAVITDPRSDAGAAGWPYVACAGEQLTGGVTDLVTGISLGGGNRAALPFTYYGSGVTFTSDAGIPNGTDLGGVRASIDLNCDGSGHNPGQVEDVFADSTNTTPLDLLTKPGPTDTIREPFVKRTLAFGPATGPNGQDETYLNEVLPSAALFPRNIRARADVTHIFISGGASTVVLGNPTPLNSVNMLPTWAGGTSVSVTLLESAGATPKLPLNCLQAPQDSLSIFFGTVTGAVTAVSVTGANVIVPVWTASLSAADLVDQTKQAFTYTTSCKTIGAAIADADNDCRADSAESSAGGTGCDAGTPKNTDADSDDDGLLDGVEVAWGSNPCSTNSDTDSRSDLEEMLGPAQYLTNPLVADSDTDLVNDGGLMVDCGVDGIPDGAPAYSSAGAATGRNRVVVQLVQCGTPPLPFEGDNCPTINGPQTNTESVDVVTGFPIGGPGFDLTQIDGDFAGNLCDDDDDNDGIPDKAELTAGFAGVACTDTGLGTGTAGTGRDTDGDGTVDGAECQRQTDWILPASRPSNAAITAVHETFYRTQGFNVPTAGCDGLGGAPPQTQSDDNVSDCIDNNIDNDAFLTGVTDPDSDNDQINDAIEVLLGSSPATQDTDRDGCSDTTELADINGDKAASFFDFVDEAKVVFSVGGPPSATAKLVADLNADGAASFFDFVDMAKYVFIGAPASCASGSGSTL